MAGIHRMAIPAVISMMLVAVSVTDAGRNVIYSHSQVHRHNLPGIVVAPIHLDSIVES